MLPDYDDIKALAVSPPLWYDDNGVPRYATFEPDMLGIYDHCAVLVEIGCQGCHERFHVGVGKTRYTFQWGQDDPVLWTPEALASNFHYGDPPRHGGCVGETMNCYDYKILEAWDRSSLEWVRVPEFEGEIEQ